MKKLMVMMLTMAVVCGVSMGGTRINEWVWDDFEGYADVNDLKATSLTTGGPWWILQELQVALGLNGLPDPTVGIIADGAILTIDLARTTDPADPNGFIAKDQTDTNPQSVAVHYDFRDATDNTGSSPSSWNCDLFTMVDNLGIPFSYVATGQPAPLDYLPVGDLTKYDKLSFKLKNAPGNTANRATFGVGLVGPDTLSIGYANAVGGGTENDFLNLAGGKWQAIEFDLNNFPINGESAFGLDMVSGIVFGTADTIGGSEQATFYIDDVSLIIEDDPADINMDGIKNLDDLAALAADWLQ